jgi:hypothetical protein
LKTEDNQYPRLDYVAALLIPEIVPVAESRPARKNYNKLTGEDVSRTRSDHLDNVDSCKEEQCAKHDANNDTDTDSSFTDIELDDRDDFSDDSDYGEFPLKCTKFAELKRDVDNSIWKRQLAEKAS